MIIKKITYFYYYNILCYIGLLVAFAGQNGTINFESNFFLEIIQMLHLCLLLLTLPFNFISLTMIFFGTASLVSITIIQLFIYIISLWIYYTWQNR